MNLPNKLTILRICMVPLFIACFYIPIYGWNYIAAALFVLAFITDIIDGRYARKHNLVTNFGKLMDPMADKLMVCSALIMLVSWGVMHPVIAVVMIAREFIVSAFRLVAVENGRVIAASWLGKVKTITQCVAVVLALLSDLLYRLIGFPIEQVFIYISLVFTVWSGIDYIVRNRKQIDFKN